MQCQKCKSELKLIPAGISKKTGKPYNAFWSCPNRCKQDGEIKIVEEIPDWEKIRSEKADSIAWMNAKNAAALAFANGKITKEQIEVFANWFYGLNPESKNQPF